MSNKQTEFKEIMIQEAARDTRIFNICEWRLFNETDHGVIEQAELMAEVADYYDLEPEDMERVMILQGIMDEDGYDQT